MIKKLSELELDALKEISNIGAGHAAMALSQLVGKKIMIAVIRSDIMPSSLFIENMVGNKDEEVAAVYLKTLGDVQGSIIYMFKKSSAIKLCEKLLFDGGGHLEFINEKAQSALKEMGNILSGAFLGTIADTLHLQVFHNSPLYAFDSAEAIMYGVSEDVFGDRKERICLGTEFIEAENKIRGSFAFVPSDGAMDKLLKCLKIK